jgi:sulfite reductase (NADPH) flavoprotein alpha-component
MNAIPPNFPVTAPPIPLIPENAPFNARQRAWLNGFLAGLYGGQGGAANAAIQAAQPEEDFPWHDPSLELEERQSLATGRPLARRLMAAMAQLDCGQCGYLCQTYAEALAEGREASAGLCVPGAKPTMRALKAILAEAPIIPAAAAAPPPAPVQPQGRPVRVLSADRLTDKRGVRDVRHVAIALDDSGLTYEPGDSLGIAPSNDPGLVAAVLRELRAAPETPIPCPDGTERPAEEAFTWHLDIARPLDRTFQLLAMAATYPPAAAALRKLADGEDGAEPADPDLLDLIQAFPSARPPLADLARSLPVLKPRLYSISSSPLAAQGEVHLTVAVVRDQRRGRRRGGVASTFLADRATGATIRAHVQTSHFRLPADPATPVIMIGPGTGIAPFRAFLQHRAAQAVRARTWLYFGAAHFASDYLYRQQLEAWLADGTLARLSLAFSRDQVNKIYVQHRMQEERQDLWRWLQDGAHLYVCGDATRMARDVDQTLRAIAKSEGGLSDDQARDWVAALARQGRYQRDVY